MDTLAIISSAATGIVSIVGSVIYFSPKLKKLKAETRKIDAETQETTTESLQSAVEGLKHIYDEKFNTLRDIYEEKLQGVLAKYNELRGEFTELRKEMVEKETVYKVDRDLLAVYKIASEKMKDCPNFEQCPGAKEFHKLTKA